MTWRADMPLPGPNPTIAAIDAGHRIQIVKTRGKPDVQSCGECASVWPCPTIRSARRDTAARTTAAMQQAS